MSRRWIRSALDSGPLSAWLPRAGRFWVPALLLLLVASRLPLIANGHGTDGDSWRNIVAALHMREAGRYVPSRVPGFPLFEVLLCLLSPGGWIATNLAAILAGLIAAFVYARLLIQLKVRNPLWPWLAFAFATPLMVTASQTMDYSFGMAFFLGAYLAALQRRYLVAGVLLGLATGCRPSYCLVGVAMVALLWARRENWKAYVACALGFVPVVIALFVPVVIAPEAQGLGGRFMKQATKHVTPASFPAFVRTSCVFLFGKSGTVMVAVALAVALFQSTLRRFRNPPNARGRTRSYSVPKDIGAFETATFLVIAGFDAIIPHPTYLFPLLPFVLIVLARLLPRYLLIAVVISMIAEPLVSVQLDERRIVAGTLFQEISRRRADLTEAREYIATNPDVPTVLVIGRMRVHQLIVLAPELERTEAGWAAFAHPGVALKSRERPVAFAATLTDKDRARLVGQGWAIEDLKIFKPRVIPGHRRALGGDERGVSAAQPVATTAPPR